MLWVGHEKRCAQVAEMTGNISRVLHLAQFKHQFCKQDHMKQICQD